MKISNVGSTKGPTPVRRRGKGADVGESFADHPAGAQAPAAASGAVEATPVGAVGSVLAAQETPAAADERLRGLARRYGDNLLDRLEPIRHGLLAGTIPKDELAGLAQTLRARRHARGSDLRLDEI